MALDYRRGSAAIQDAATMKSGGGFRPFMPSVQWKQDGESKYVLILSDIDDVGEFLLHQFIPVGRGTKSNGEEFTRYDEFLSRKDPAIGEDYDDLEDRLEREPKTRCIGVMVELEPIVKGKKITGFVAKTETFTRKTDDGEVETTAPVIGLCTQSAYTLWGALDSYNSSLGSLIDIPLQIIRRGKDQNTRYDIIPFKGDPVDLSPVIEFMDGITYVGDDLEELTNLVEAEDGDVAKAQTIAQFLFDKRIDELADPERYEELVGPLHLEDMPKQPWGRKNSSKPAAKPARPERRSPRQAAQEEHREPRKNERFAALKERVEQG